MAMITIDEAVGHLRLDLLEDDYEERIPDLQLKMAQAEAIIIDYLKHQETWWYGSDTPYVIKAAILIMLSALWEDREGTSIGDYLKPEGAIANLLRRYRDPALA